MLKTNTGDKIYQVLYPKYKKGGHIVRKVLEKCTYGKFYHFLFSLQCIYSSLPLERPTRGSHRRWSSKRGGPSSAGENNVNLSMCPLA